MTTELRHAEASGMSARLGKLVADLDAVGAGVSADRVARALSAGPIRPEDVAGFVGVSESGYARRRVVRREGYEILVMTWAPGQGSGPHDHAGSVCGLTVVQGRLRETSYADSADGTCNATGWKDLYPGEQCVDPGVVTHGLSNPAGAGGEVAVSVHVYAPPLAMMRRHAVRPSGMGVPEAFTRAAGPDAHRVVIVGGGFAGAVTAANLLRAAPGKPLEVVLIDSGASPAEGVAYRTPDRRHLLNVPAGRMSAYLDRPEDFVQFLAARDASVSAGTFAPRAVYGEYLRHTLDEAARGAPESTACRFVRDTAESVVPEEGDRWRVTTAGGEQIVADTVVLALGHRPPADPFVRKWSGPRHRWVSDPWASLTLGAVREDEPVVLMGSGLTAVDVVLSLGGAGRTAPVHVISPRGLMPQAHATTPLTPADGAALVAAACTKGGGVSPRALLRAIREAAEAGLDWRQAVDALRPHTTRVWRSMSGVQREQFLRHARRFWEVHRHRMAPRVAEAIEAARRSGRLVVHAGRVRAVEATEAGLRVRYAPLGAGGTAEAEVSAKWAVNCTGPGIDVRSAPHPVLRSLLTRGKVVANELGLGLETTPDGFPLDARGRMVDSLVVVGTLRKATLWESTAVPELRAQAQAAARSALHRLHLPELCAEL